MATKWEDDSIQFPRLIAELQMAGAFTDDVINALIVSMDLEKREVHELIDRGCDKWDEIVLGLKPTTQRWYVVKSHNSGKFADGFYGWDCSIHSEHQIFAEDALPYIECADFENILVGEGSDKPSVSHAREVVYGQDG